MFKAKSWLQINAGKRNYQFICDPESPLNEVIDVLKKITKDVEIILEEAIKNSEKEKEIQSEVQIEQALQEKEVGEDG